jgi:hypothetical protein
VGAELTPLFFVLGFGPLFNHGFAEPGLYSFFQNRISNLAGPRLGTVEG